VEIENLGLGIRVKRGGRREYWRIDGTERIDWYGHAQAWALV
jgi:hypothetical protein